MKGTTTVDLDTVARNWSISTRSQSRGLYALALIRTDVLDVAATFTDDPAMRTLSSVSAREFVFDVAPQSIDLEEPASVQIVPTQNGGQFIEHQGSIYKNIMLQGTTGLRPNRGQSGGIIPILGVPNPFSSPSINSLNGLPTGEESGFERLLKLRNLFRAYFDIKQNPELASKFVMVWQNGKEGEFYIVEPMTFKTRRSSTSPLTAEYDIQLRTIRRLDFLVFEGAPDSRRERGLGQRVNEWLTHTTRQLSSSLRKANALADRTVTLGQATINNVLQPGAELFNALSLFAQTTQRAIAVPRNSVSTLATAAMEAYTELQQIDSEIDVYRTQGLSSQLSEAWSAYRNIFREAARVYSMERLHFVSAGNKFNTRAQAYRNPATGHPINGGSPTDLQNAAAPAGTALSTVKRADTIFSLALRLLGDSARWKELVILNDLKPPYVSVSGDGRRILRPNDQILYPTANPDAQVGAVESDPTDDNNPLVKRLGRDVKLRSYGSAGGITELDFEINSRGDLAVIEGVDNMIQAVEIKFSTERGTLPTHPRFGISAPIGSKALIRTLVGFQLDARLCLISDSRISNVNKLNFTIDGNVLNVVADIQIADIDQAVSLNFNARR